MQLDRVRKDERTEVIGGDLVVLDQLVGLFENASHVRDVGMSYV